MSALEQDLDEYGDDPDFGADPTPPQNAEQASWQLRRLAKVRAQMAEIERVAQADIDRAEAWKSARLEALRKDERFWADGLEMWHRAVLSEDPSRKTISLPCGTLKSRAQQPVWEFDDETFIAWASEHAPELVRIPEPKPAIDRNAAKKALTPAPNVATLDGQAVLTPEGELVPGVSVSVRPPSFTVVTEQEVDG